MADPVPFGFAPGGWVDQDNEAAAAQAAREAAALRQRKAIKKPKAPLGTLAPKDD